MVGSCIYLGYIFLFKCFLNTKQSRSCCSVSESKI
ncbi:hypothetical protein MUK42_32911 [Musa troglodytarum]|uniref:Uncharacterized protein n=1 Tax=Musa troglodytarum TaxID=320322 RepID=A0A9E7F6Y6_9LILI|nr:hypothetical protein MUK42_32911 [Musa troglodytarum]